MMSVVRVTLILFSCVLLTQCAEIPRNDIAVDYVTERGVHIQFPFFSNSIKSINTTLAGYIREDIHEILEYTYKNIESPPGYVGCLNVAKNYALMCKRHVNRRKKLGIRAGFNGTFNLAMKEMYFRVLDRSKMEEKRLKAENAPHDRVALNAKVKRGMEVLETVVEKSPVASYLDLSGGTIDGENFEEYVAKLMGELKYNGIGNILDYLGGLLKLLSMLTGSSSSAITPAPAA